jgi:3-oxoadipate enol-lactonase
MAQEEPLAKLRLEIPSQEPPGSDCYENRRMYGGLCILGDRPVLLPCIWQVRYICTSAQHGNTAVTSFRGGDYLVNRGHNRHTGKPNMIVGLTSCIIFALVCSFYGGRVNVSPASAGSYIEVSGAKVWYEECGAAPSLGVVLLHDGLLHSVTWDDVWPSLCGKYHVVRYDRRGYGRSEPAKTPFVPEDDLYQVIRQTHMDRAVIVGNSSGGGLALDFALAHPEMVEALFLIGPVVHGMATSTYFNERSDENDAPLDKGDVRAAAENWSKDRFLIAGNEPRSRKQIYDALAQNPQNLKVSAGAEIRPSPPTVDRLSQIRVPILVLVGEVDIADVIADVFAHSGAIEAMAPLASFEVWKDAGHLIQLQHPEELVSRFNQFVLAAERQEIHLAENQIYAYVGQYKIGNRAAKVMLKDHRLILEIPGKPYYWLFAASETIFFLRTEKAEVEFTKDAQRKVIGMIVHNSDGSVIWCPRL